MVSKILATIVFRCCEDTSLCVQKFLSFFVGFPVLFAAAPSRRQLTVERRAEIAQLRKCGARMKRSILPLLPHRCSMPRCFGGCELCVREPDVTRTRAVGIPGGSVRGERANFTRLVLGGGGGRPDSAVSKPSFASEYTFKFKSS